MQLPALNANIIIIAVLIVTALYGLVAGKQRLRILILSVYVGIVLAGQLKDTLAPHLPMLGADQVAWLLFGLPIVIFGIVGIAHKKAHDKGAFIANLLVGLCTGALIVSSALQLLPTSQMSAIDNDSFLALNLQQFHLWILGLLPVVALLMGFMHGKEHKGH
ncbi:MAG TPA: hypothetical protein VMT30_05570 [Candidatus Saccharimonadia bacterium]|nr:hypothetical protein [Candidatus Saccharimonadia bacterium]